MPEPFPLAQTRFESSLPMAFVAAANWSRNVGPQRKRNVVLHSMEWAEKGDTAEQCAAYFAGQKTTPEATRSSAHFCIDSNSIVMCVRPELVAWHAPGANQLGIGIEHAGFARQSAAEWRDDFSSKMLALSAKLCAELCQHFRIPVEFVDRTDLRAGLMGITTHAEVTLAFAKSTHMDPGVGFPMRDYLALVRSHTIASSGLEV